MLQKKTLKGNQGHRQEKEKKLNLPFILNCYRERKQRGKESKKEKK